MLKSLLVVTLLSAPALADTKSMHLGFTLGAGKDSRHYKLELVTDACGGIEAKAPDEHDKINVCAKADGNSDVRLEIDWQTTHGDRELRNRSTVVAARGQSFELDGGAAKLTVTLQ